jgi:hypothetical protein
MTLLHTLLHPDRTWFIHMLDTLLKLYVCAVLLFIILLWLGRRR